MYSNGSVIFGQKKDTDPDEWTVPGDDGKRTSLTKRAICMGIGETL
jgi:hypothetical protein